jgi:xanthine dehydrogenase accessory factor
VQQEQAFVLATIIGRHGSTPRTAGTRMIVAADGRAIGTIGGGALEARVIETAGQVLTSRRPRLLSFNMAPSELDAMDMICGGQLDVLLEFITPDSTPAAIFKNWRDLQCAKNACLFVTLLDLDADKVTGIHHCLFKNRQAVQGELPLTPETVVELAGQHAAAAGLRTVELDDALILVEPVLAAESLFIFGAGHVAQPTARLAALVGFGVRIVDDRPEFANAQRFPEAEQIRVAAEFGQAFDGLDIDSNTYIVIVTRGHVHDQTVLIQALRTGAGYIGMIGSRSKRDHIFAALLKQGFTQSDLERVHCPIGLPIGAETPEEIALSITAELVQARAQRRCS